MLTRCAFMSSRPSSNTANRAIGPAPMMSTSVLIGSAMLTLPDAQHERIRRAAASRLDPGEPAPTAGRNRRPCSRLPLRRPHHQAVEVLAHLDLAREARVRLHVEGEIEHVLLHRRGLAGLLLPALVDVDVTGRARACTAAFGL